MPRLLLALWLLLAISLAGPASAESVRLRVVLVLDASGSMAGQDPGRLVRVASKMLSDIADERDHVTVLSFGTEVKTLTAARGSQHDQLRSAIDTLGRHESCTDYAQALEGAAAILKGKAPPKERRLVLFLTDGRFEPANENKTCNNYELLKDDELNAITARTDAATKTLADAGARVFTIGLGNAPRRAARSAALLERIARETGGRYVHAKVPRDVPRIFANIFGALVGAPVMQLALDRTVQSTKFTVPRGATRLHVVLVPDSPGDLDKVTLKRGSSTIALEPAQIENGTRSSYRIARVKSNAAGDYTLTGTGTGRIDVLVIPDVGLSLRIEGVPKVLPEHEHLQGRVAVRTRLGDPVSLAPEFLRHVKFTVKLGRANLFDSRPGGTGAAKFRTTSPLARGKYTISATASHAFGFLDLKPVSHDFSVEPRFQMKVIGGPLVFDTMAEKGLIPLTPPFKAQLALPKKMPIEVTVDLVMPDSAADLILEPKSITFAEGQPREVALSLRWADPKKLRSKSQSFTDNIRVVPRPAQAQLLIGDKEWKIPIAGKLRAWTWKRYLQEYKWQLGIGLAILLLIIWLAGRMIANKFPPKARIHYVEVGIEFENDSLIKRYARHGAFRSAKFQYPLNRKVRAQVEIESTGAGFQVIPAGSTTITVLDDLLPEGERERRKPFRGSWEQRYRLGDSYEIWLTRS